MKNLFILLGLLLAVNVTAQNVGSTKTEQFKASFETKVDISQYLDYSGPTIPIQILKCGIGIGLGIGHSQSTEMLMAMVLVSVMVIL
jgi:hypothetical protein